MHASSPNVLGLPHSDKLVAGEPLPITIGDVVGGKYTIDSIIGIGGMGVVASATHKALGQRVALKVMRSARMNPETADRFLTEARACVSLKSSHVAKVLDVGTLESGLPYMVMELLEGADLATKLEKRNSLPCAEAVEYVLQACDAISEAHALGIVHRDLKPENLFVTERRDGTPLVKVLDFGISKITNIEEAPKSRRAITHESTVMGSPMYMSPEQVRSAKHVDGRTDIWALGAILYELVTGRGPFAAESVPDIFVKVLEKPAPRLEDALPDAPAGLAEVIARCLEKEREKRFETVDELAAALANLGVKATRPTVPPWDRSTEIVLDENGNSVPPAPGPGLPRTSSPLLEQTITPSTRKVTADTFVLPHRRRSWGRRFALLFVMLLLGGAAFAAVGVYRGKPLPFLKLSAPIAASPAPVAPPTVAAASAATAAAAAPAAPEEVPSAAAAASVVASSAVAAASSAPSKTPAKRGGPAPRPPPAKAVAPPHPPAPPPPPVTAAPAPPAPPAASGNLHRTDW